MINVIVTSAFTGEVLLNSETADAHTAVEIASAISRMTCSVNGENVPLYPNVDVKIEYGIRRNCL